MDYVLVYQGGEFLGRIPITALDRRKGGDSWLHSAHAAARRVFGPGAYLVTSAPAPEDDDRPPAARHANGVPRSSVNGCAPLDLGGWIE